MGLSRFHHEDHDDTKLTMFFFVVIGSS